jgi:hypothetical protein
MRNVLKTLFGLYVCFLSHISVQRPSAEVNRAVAKVGLDEWSQGTRKM